MPVFSIQSPDGRTIDIEAADERSAIIGAENWVAQNPKPKESVGLSGYADYLGNAATLGGLDRLQAAARSIASGKDFSKVFEEEKASSKSDASQMGGLTQLGLSLAGAIPLVKAARGIGGLAMKGAGALGVGAAGARLAQAAQSALPASVAAGAANIGSRAAAMAPAGGYARAAGAGALEGAGYGGAEAAIRDEDIGAGITSGAALGGVVGALGRGISNKLEKPKYDMSAKAPSVDKLKEEAKRFFDTAKSGITIIQPSAADAIRNNIVRSTRDFTKSPILTPDTIRMTNQIMSEAGKPMTIRQFDVLRQELNSLSKPQRGAQYSADNAALISMREALEDGIKNLNPSQVFSTRGIGNRPPQGAARLDPFKTYYKGIEEWKKAKTAETIKGIIDNIGIDASRYTQSGMENAIRSSFRNLAKDKIQMRFYSPEVQDMIRQIAEGTPMKNILRRLGKFAPDDAFRSLPYMFAGKAGIPLGVLAHGSRAMSNRIAKQEANQLLDYVSMGGARNLLPVPQWKRNISPYIDEARQVTTAGLLGQP